MVTVVVWQSEFESGTEIDKHGSGGHVDGENGPDHLWQEPILGLHVNIRMSVHDDCVSLYTSIPMYHMCISLYHCMYTYHCM